MKNHKIVFLFSGQGSHYRGMGSELFSTDASFRSAMEFSDTIVQKNTGRSLIHELYQVQDRKFDELLMTHPAIVAVEVAMLQLMEKMEVQPNLVVGNSLGEFAAGVAAGVWTGEQAVSFSIKRAKAIVENVAPGGMMAVLHERTPELTSQLKNSGLYVASDNFKGHFTVSGLAENINAFKQYLDSRNISHLRLDVAYPFHSPYMDVIRDHHSGNDAAVSLHLPVKTKMYSPLQEKVIETAIGPDYFWHAVSQPFNFGAMLATMEKEHGPCLYIDLGPSGTMATFVKYNLPPGSLSVSIPLLSPFKGVEKRLSDFRRQIEEQQRT